MLKKVVIKAVVIIPGIRSAFRIHQFFASWHADDPVADELVEGALVVDIDHSSENSVSGKGEFFEYQEVSSIQHQGVIERIVVWLEPDDYL